MEKTPETPTAAQIAAQNGTILAEGLHHAMEVISGKLGCTLQEKLIALTWVTSGLLAMIPDTKTRKEARGVIERQTSINLARILSGVGADAKL